MSNRQPRTTIAQGLALLVVASTFVACAARQPAEPTEATEATEAKQTSSVTTPAATEPSHAKAQAPVELSLKTSGLTGEIDVELTVTALADLAGPRARVVVPKGVRLLADAEQTLSPMTKGQQATFKTRVFVPAAGAFTLAGGVEVVMGPGRQLAKSTTIAVGTGTPKKEAAEIVRLPEGDSVRVVRPKSN